MNMPATAGQTITIERTELKRLRRRPWVVAIVGSFAFALSVGVAHVAHIGPYIDRPATVSNLADKEVCRDNRGAARLRWRMQSNTYSITCRDGAEFRDVQFHLTEQPVNP